MVQKLAKNGIAPDGRPMGKLFSCNSRFKLILPFQKIILTPTVFRSPGCLFFVEDPLVFFCCICYFRVLGRVVFGFGVGFGFIIRFWDMALSHSIGRSIAPQYLCNDSVLQERKGYKNWILGWQLAIFSLFWTARTIEIGASAVSIIFGWRICSFLYIYI